MTEEPSGEGERRWYYELRGVNLADYIKRILMHLDLLITILSARPRRVLEVGCGTASNSCFLSYLGTRCFSLDEATAAMGAAMATKKSYCGRNQIVRGDAFHLPFADDSFDACFSSGLMEHFSDQELLQLLREQIRVARRIVFCVPSDHYPLREWGDERRLSPDQWMQILTSWAAAVGASTHARYERFDLKRVKDMLVQRRRPRPNFVLVIAERRGWCS